ncbi:beta-galactosidase [Candidatus Epulonipiscioides gigas]|nr:beta-galactosidase [Epulopiscium sp. SCG-C07WGA-EpuloA2]
MYLGVDYYPEHWDIEKLEDDLKNIKNLGSNVIRIGEFSWHMMENQEGKYDFSYFDHVIEKAEKFKLQVIFGTPTATLPAWLAHKHPEVLSEFVDGTKREFGGRRQYCFNSPIYNLYSKNIITKLAKHYKNEKRIVAWQIDNEFGHEGSDICFCDCCKNTFRKYLKKVYNNDINKLNYIWGTRFWSQTYNTFEEIPLPKLTITTHNPTLQMEWERFRALSVEKYAKMQVDILKKILGKNTIVLHDFSGGFFDKSYDFSQVAKHIDVVAYNNYPVWGGQIEPIPAHEIACGLDYMRGLKKQNFWITEAIMGAQGHDVIGYLPRPNQAKMWSYQAMARGCSSLMYFRYRGAIKGAEQYCYGIIDNDNINRRKYDEVKVFFNDIKKYENFIEAKVNSKVALVYDYESMASFRIQRQSELFDYKKEVYRLYKPFYNANINIDVIPSSASFDEYNILLVPVMIVHRKEIQNKIRKFAKAGKTVILTFRNSVKDKYNNLTLGEFNPVGFTDFIGGYVEEIESFGQNQQIKLVGQNEFSEVKGYATVFRDLIKPTTAKILFNYDEEFFTHLSAITVNNYNDANVYYIGAGIDDNIMNKIVSEVLKDSNIKAFETPEGVELVKREDEDKLCYFLINHTDKVQTLIDITLSAYEVKIITIN